MVSQPDGDQAQEVKSRNFAEPRRLSRQRLRRLEREAASTLNTISSNLAVPLRKYHKLTMGSVAELNVSHLFDDLESPFVVLCFLCRSQPAWLVWESAAAAATSETILGSAVEGEGTARRLSQTECLVIKQLLCNITEPTMKVLGFEFEADSVLLTQDPEELSTVEDWGPDADTQRLYIHLSFDGPGGPSELRMYLPGIEPESGDEDHDAPQAAPQHLNGVNLDLRAFLASVDIPLTDLLRLEPGDVIPLGIAAGSPLKVFVEDRACATAHWGKHGPHLAIRINEICQDDLEFDQPSES